MVRGYDRSSSHGRVGRSGLFNRVAQGFSTETKPGAEGKAPTQEPAAVTNRRHGNRAKQTIRRRKGDVPDALEVLEVDSLQVWQQDLHVGHLRIMPEPRARGQCGGSGLQSPDAVSKPVKRPRNLNRLSEQRQFSQQNVVRLDGAQEPRLAQGFGPDQAPERMAILARPEDPGQPFEGARGG